MARIRKGLDPASLAWAQSLKETLRVWLAANGYANSMVLARELEVPAKKWSHLIAGNAISRTEIYAKIFRRTGLPEADPRGIPPQRDGVRRAWTPQQYQHWLSKQSSKAPPTAVAKPAAGTGGVFEQLLAEMQRTRQTVERLTEILQPTSGSLDEVEMLVQKLKARMDLAISGTAAARDRFQNRHGAALAALLALADALSEKDRATREKKAERIREFGEVQL